jgi:hypothetical protein
MDLIELAIHFESLRDETNPIWYLIYYPFQFQCRKILPAVSENKESFD